MWLPCLPCMPASPRTPVWRGDLPPLAAAPASALPNPAIRQAGRPAAVPSSAPADLFRQNPAHATSLPVSSTHVPLPSRLATVLVVLFIIGASWAPPLPPILSPSCNPRTNSMPCSTLFSPFPPQRCAPRCPFPSLSSAGTGLQLNVHPLNLSCPFQLRNRAPNCFPTLLAALCLPSLPPTASSAPHSTALARRKLCDNLRYRRKGDMERMGVQSLGTTGDWRPAATAAAQPIEPEGAWGTKLQCQSSSVHHSASNSWSSRSGSGKRRIAAMPVSCSRLVGERGGRSRAA